MSGYAQVNARHREQYEEIDSMLTKVEDDLEDKDQRNPFIESLREQFTKTKSLSVRQFDALKTAYDRVE